MYNYLSKWVEYRNGVLEPCFLKDNLHGENSRFQMDIIVPSEENLRYARQAIVAWELFTMFRMSSNYMMIYI